MGEFREGPSGEAAFAFAKKWGGDDGQAYSKTTEVCRRVPG
jgi:hypothetical protein